MTDDQKLTNENLFDRVRGQAEREMARLPIPGAVVGITLEDQEWTAAFGVTSVENPLPVTADTLFQVGSITKTFVTTAVMRLVEMGKLDLDQPIRAYLPGLKLMDESVAARVTLRHLLTHTGGWNGDYFNDFGMGEDALAKMIAKLADLPQITPLGEVWSYNNSGFYLAGRVIEVVTGTNFEAALKELVLDPLGLKNTFFFPQDVLTHRFVVGHELVDKQLRVARPWAVGRAMHPAGGIVCSVKELLRYARFHMGDGRAPDGARLLSTESLATMQTPMLPATGMSSIGLSWFILSINGTRIIGHGGGTLGQLTNLSLVPEQRFAVAVLTNSDEGWALCSGIANFAQKLYLGLESPETAPLDTPEEVLRVYLGAYEAAEQLCEVTLRGGQLTLQVTPKGGFPTPDSPPPPPPPPVRMALYAQDRFILLDEPMKDSRGEFLRAADGRVTWLRQDGRIHTRRA